MTKQLQLWHQFIETQQPEILDLLLDDQVRFHSPFVWKPKEGKAITILILTTVVKVFKDFRYVREIVDVENWALEFEAKIGDLSLRGIDLIQLNPAGRIIDFEVMVRPANALQILGLEMGKRLTKLS